MSLETAVALDFDGEQLEGVLVGRRDGAPRPCVILFPTVAGISEIELGYARQLVELGYSGFVADLYGKQFRGAPRATGAEQMRRVQADRAALRRRLLAVVEAVRGQAGVDGERIVAAGFCFGGLCALDVARSGADIAAAASFHGLFDPPRPSFYGGAPQAISAKVIAFHGWDDPMVPPAKVVALGQELTAAGADWQIHAYGGVRHGFTNPGADALGIPAVRYDAVAAERAWTAFISLLEEMFG